MTALMTAVVVDDEERARRRLSRMLGAFPAISVVGEASCGQEAVGLIDRLRPEIVFLDVQMPDMDGFGVLERLPYRPRYVVFTTAFDRYALQAFSVGAVDYLLKPFGERELARAVARAVERAAEERFQQGYERLLQALDRPRHLERIPVRYLRDIVLLPVGEISSFEADREMVSINTRTGQAYATEMTLAELEQKLDSERFFRAHRRAIINLDHLMRLEPMEGNRYMAVLEGGRVEVSRTASRRLRERLGI